MTTLRRLVFDTNVLVSAALRIGSPPERALRKARLEAVLIASNDMLDELHEVLLRNKFDQHIERGLREAAFQEYAELCSIVSIPFSIRACRDPRDDKFLEAAIHGQADAIITGDADLLALHPFSGVVILTPAAYLELP